VTKQIGRLAPGVAPRAKPTNHLRPNFQTAVPDLRTSDRPQTRDFDGRACRERTGPNGEVRGTARDGRRAGRARPPCRGRRVEGHDRGHSLVTRYGHDRALRQFGELRESCPIVGQRRLPHRSEPLRCRGAEGQRGGTRPSLSTTRMAMASSTKASWAFRPNRMGSATMRKDFSAPQPSTMQPWCPATVTKLSASRWSTTTDPSKTDREAARLAGPDTTLKAAAGDGRQRSLDLPLLDVDAVGAWG
jgi:hypothetical protein